MLDCILCEGSIEIHIFSEDPRFSNIFENLVNAIGASWNILFASIRYARVALAAFRAAIVVVVNRIVDFN